MSADTHVYHVYLLRRPDGTPLRAFEDYDACQRDLGDALRLLGPGYTTTGVPFTPSRVATTAPSAMGPRASDWTAMAKAAGAAPVAFAVTAADQARIAAFGNGGVHDDRATPPAAPVAVTEAMVFAALDVLDKRGWSPPRACGFAADMSAAIQAAIAAAAPAVDVATRARP